MAWLWLPGLALAAYLAICALLLARQRDLIYFPQMTRPAAAAADFSLQRPVPGGADLALRGWVVQPGRTDALIYFGGNAERVENNRADFARHLPGRSVYLLPYRGYGDNPGQPREQVLVADALALFDEVRRRHPHGRVAVMGRSLGSGVAAALAAKRPVERLVLVTPFDSLAAAAQAHYPWLPVRWLLRDRYESTRHLAGYARPCLVLRAGRDQVVPPGHTDRLLAALPHRPEVVDFADAGHDDLSDSPRYWQALARFLPGSGAD